MLLRYPFWDTVLIPCRAVVDELEEAGPLVCQCQSGFAQGGG